MVSEYLPLLRGDGNDFGAWVNPYVCEDDILRTRVFIESITRHISMCPYNYDETIPDHTPLYEYITNPDGTINDVGVDWKSYTPVKDGHVAIF